MRPPSLCRNLSLFSQHHLCFLLPCLCCHISHPSGSYSTVSSLHQPCALVGGSNEDFPCLFVLQSLSGDGFVVVGVFLQRLTEESKLELEIGTARGKTSFPVNSAFGGVKTMSNKMKKQNVFESLGCSFSEKRLEGEGGHNLSPFLVSPSPRMVLTPQWEQCLEGSVRRALIQYKPNSNVLLLCQEL